MRSQLFREEVINNQRNKEFGETLIKTPPHLLWSGLLLTSLGLTILTVLVLADYYRKESVQGVLLPSKGLIQVHSPFPSGGTVKEIFVNEGQRVEKGSSLLSVTQQRMMESGIELTAMKKTEIEQIKSKLESRLIDLPQMREKERAGLLSELQNADQNIRALRERRALSYERLALKQSRHKRLEPLYRDKVISTDDYQQNMDSLLQLKDRLKSDEQDLLQALQLRLQTQLRLDNLDAHYQEKEGQILSELTAHKRDLVDLSFQNQQAIIAPVSGTITSLRAYPGAAVDASNTLLTIQPDDATLEGHLFVPSRAIGFVETGQSVVIQYSAFPFQKYGVHEGQISQVGGAILQAKDLSDFDLGPVSEPVYRIKVQLKDQRIHAYGRSIPLQAGMLLRADIILESRSLWEWILEPFYRVRKAS